MRHERLLASLLNRTTSGVSVSSFRRVCARADLHFRTRSCAFPNAVVCISERGRVHREPTQLDSAEVAAGVCAHADMHSRMHSCAFPNARACRYAIRLHTVCGVANIHFRMWSRAPPNARRMSICVPVCGLAHIRMRAAVEAARAHSVDFGGGGGGGGGGGAPVPPPPPPAEEGDAIMGGCDDARSARDGSVSPARDGSDASMRGASAEDAGAPLPPPPPRRVVLLPAPARHAHVPAASQREPSAIELAHDDEEEGR